MNIDTKKIVIILTAGVVIFGILGGVLFKMNNDKFRGGSRGGDVENMKDEAQNNAQSTGVTPDPPFVSQGVIIITDNGATPTRADVKVGKTLQIINKTNNEVALLLKGIVNENIKVPPGKTVESKILNKVGKITAYTNNNKDVVCVIEVK